MARPQVLLRRQTTQQSGSAAIEFAIVLPVLLLLFFGMVNLTQYIAMKRKVQSAAELIADLVTRQQTTIPASLIDDYFKAVELSFKPMELARIRSDIGIDLYSYRLIDGSPQIHWSKFYQGASRCTQPTVNSNDPDDTISTLVGESDVVVAVVCMGYTAPAANFPGLQFFTNTRIERQFALRPRQTGTLNCVPNGCP